MSQSTEGTSRTVQRTNAAPVPAAGTGRPHRDRPLVYYRHGGVTVSDTWLVCGDHRYPIAELGELRTVRSPRSVITVSAAGCAVVVAVVVMVSARFLSLAGWIGAGVILAVPVVVAVAGTVRGRPYELWAQYQGRTVPLLWDNDAQRYHQICRALVRAQEHRRAA